MKVINQDSIMKRAYEIWEQSGRPHGLDKEHWLQAERELLDAAPDIETEQPAQVATEKGPKEKVAEKVAAKTGRRRPASGESARPR